MMSLKKNHSIRLILIFLILGFNSCNNKIEVDLISHNGIIYSLDDNNNVFEATAFKNGKIIDIGKTHQILNKYQSKNKLDLQGKIAYPGFIDAHCHFLYYGLQLAMVDLSSANSFEEIIEILKKNNDKNDGDWLIGYGWDQNQWKDKNWPNNKLLNKNFNNINVVLNRIDGHAIMVNETAIKTAKVPTDTLWSVEDILKK